MDPYKEEKDRKPYEEEKGRRGEEEEKDMDQHKEEKDRTNTDIHLRREPEEVARIQEDKKPTDREATRITELKQPPDKGPKEQRKESGRGRGYWKKRAKKEQEIARGSRGISTYFMPIANVPTNPKDPSSPTLDEMSESNNRDRNTQGIRDGNQTQIPRGTFSHSTQNSLRVTTTTEEDAVVESNQATTEEDSTREALKDLLNVESEILTL